MTNEEVWQRTLGEVELSVSRATFATWFQNTSLSLENKQSGIAVVFVPNAFAKDWLQKKYHKCILKALRNQHDEIKNIEYHIASQKSDVIARTRQKTAPHNEQLEFKEFSSDPNTGLNPKYTLDSFIVGSFNELAYTAATSVAKNIAKLYNPFLVSGGVGLGKTHLLQAIGNEIKKTMPHLKILYLTSERFASELISLLQNKEPLQAFKDKYRNVDVLIMDDVQFLAGKSKTEEEFFHTFNTLSEQGKQMIFSSDKPPQTILNLAERLRSRFEAGLIADIGEPEYEARLAILQLKSREKEYPQDHSVLEHTASVIQKNIRELEGALNLLVARSKMKSQPLTLEEAKIVLEQLTSKSKKIVSVQQIIQAVVEFYDLGEKEIFERSRRREIVKPRQIAMYLLREDFHGSYPYIGQKFGGRDHTTALHAYEKISRELKSDLKLVEEVKVIREKLYKS